MKFRTKLFAGFTTMLALFVIFSVIVLRMLFSMNAAMHGVVDDDYSKVKLANAVRLGINSLEVDSSEMLIASDPKQIEASTDKIALTRANLSDNLTRLEAMFDEESDARKLVQEVHRLHDAYIASSDTSLQLMEANKRDEALAWHNTDTEPIRQTLFDNIKQFNALQEQEMDRALAQSTSTYRFAIRLIAGLVVFTFLGSAFVSIWVYRSVLRSLGRVITVMKQASLSETSDQLPRIDIRTKDEMASIALAYNVMAASLEDHASYQKQANLLLQEQNWVQTKFAEVTGKYQGVQSLRSLASIFIAAVAPVVGASYGVFYNRKDSEDGVSRLVRAGSYAAGAADVGEAGFELGEGLVGQCAAENRTIVLDEVPASYIRIGSGLVDASPVQIVILPIPFEGHVVAVVELASFKPFARAHLQLLEELANVLGITINSVSGHMRIQQLLNESQIFAEELQTQSEELQLQQEELKTLNEQLRDQIEASERKSAELERIRNVLEEKNEHILLASGYKTEFLTNMSHELRTPLNSLLILSQMLASNKDGNLNPKEVEYAETIYSSGKDLLGLINEVLDLSKIEAGKLDIVSDWVKLTNLTEFVERQFQPVASEKGLRFDVRLDDELAELMIHTDEQRLQQILQNLLSNAFKFTEQGSVSMRMTMIAKEEVPGAPNAFIGDYALVIAVSDTGIGIPKEKQALVFEAFRQADGTTSRRYGGTGLGLSICQKIAQLLNGFIQLQSDAGAGSTFTLYIPVTRLRGGFEDSALEEAAAGFEAGIAAPVQGPRTPVDQALEGKKILLVDDDLRNIYALTTVLEAHRIEVIFAENGQDGIELLQANSDVDLVIMDIMMPKMDGYEAIREIRKHERYAELPIIALTAKAMKYDRDRCIEAGANDYISKPILLDQLLSLIRVWLYR